MHSMIKNEHALVIITDHGVVVITGCAHPGIVDILRRAKTLTGKEILLVMGGFHLMHDYPASIRSVIAAFEALGVQYVAPSHCTGEEAIRPFKRAFRNRYIESGVGKIITIDDLKPL
jgi:7,8-dihydropterin-6-yl-methyl-4-(beta-D-ribofuranosyl)aminobenzene 5'-phosphate synthase